MNDGPLPVFCRGHSGGRILCEAYVRNGIQMGDVAPDRKDTTSFALSLNPAVRELVMASYRYPALPAAEQSRLQELMVQNVATFRRRETDGVSRFGWKMGTNIFTMLVFLDAFPAGRCVHLIRDGRDVMLSRLDNRFDFADPANRLMVFGDEAVDTWLDRPLAAALAADRRNALEMQHWATAVEYGLRGRASDRCLEMRYEDLCRQPEHEAARLFDFLRVPLLDSTRQWLVRAVTASRIRKWQRLSDDEMAMPLLIGRPLLTRLGYC